MPLTKDFEFRAWEKIPRLKQNCVITEKIDGTNACVVITEDGRIGAQSRNKIITPEDDNCGFARWVSENEGDLLTLGPGYHYGEWWGSGIQRRYGMDRKVFSLFNVGRWSQQPRPSCCDLVPTLYTGVYGEEFVVNALEALALQGSMAAPGFMEPEGVIVYFTQSRQLFKRTFDDKPKGL